MQAINPHEVEADGSIKYSITICRFYVIAPLIIVITAITYDKLKQLPPSSVFIIFVSDLGLFPAPLYAIIPTMYWENFSRPVKVPLCT